MSDASGQGGAVDVFVYTRYSIDKNGPNSTERQLQRIIPCAKANNFNIVRIYSDEEKINWSFVDRTAFAEMMSDIQTSSVRVIFLEQADRITRMPNLMFETLEKFNRFNIKVFSVQEGYINDFVCMVLTVVGWKQQKDMGDRVRSGLLTSWRNGFWFGPPPYGYRTDAENRLEIYWQEARVTLRACELYVYDDFAPATIGRLFEAEQIPPPGSRWGVHSFLGPNLRSGLGLFSNELHIGIGYRNKTQEVIDSSTGRRNTILKDKAEWERQEWPHLAFMPVDLFWAVQRRRMERGHLGRGPTWSRLFSGLMKCPTCGGNLTISSSAWTREPSSPDAARIACSNHHNDSRKCPDGRSKYYFRVEKAVFSCLSIHLTSNSAAEAYAESYNRQILHKKNSGPSISHLNSRLMILQEQKETAYNDYLEKKFPQDLALSRVRSLEVEQKNIRFAIAEHGSLDSQLIGTGAFEEYKAAIDAFSMFAPRNVKEIKDPHLLSAVSIIRKMTRSIIVRWEAQSPHFELEIDTVFGRLTFDSRQLDQDVLDSVLWSKKMCDATALQNREDRSVQLAEFDRTHPQIEATPPADGARPSVLLAPPSDISDELASGPIKRRGRRRRKWAGGAT